MSVLVIEVVYGGPDNRRAAPRSVKGTLLMQVLRLKRGLFGYTPESVRLLLADRDKMFIRAAELAKAAEALVLELRSEVEALKAQVDERQAGLRPAESDVANLRTDRDATRVELDRAAATVAQLTTDVETARKELEDARELVRVADAQLARRTATSRSVARSRQGRGETS
jgi:chromosome segregation ATPase